MCLGTPNFPKLRHKQKRKSLSSRDTWQVGRKVQGRNWAGGNVADSAREACGGFRRTEEPGPVSGRLPRFSVVCSTPMRKDYSIPVASRFHSCEFCVNKPGRFPRCLCEYVRHHNCRPSPILEPGGKPTIRICKIRTEKYFSTAPARRQCREQKADVGAAAIHRKRRLRHRNSFFSLRHALRPRS